MAFASLLSYSHCLGQADRAGTQEIATVLKLDETSDNTEYLIEHFNKSEMVIKETVQLQVGVFSWGSRERVSDFAIFMNWQFVCMFRFQITTTNIRNASLF